MTCKYRKGTGTSGKCSLGIYGGSCTDGNMKRCIGAGQNNPEYAAKISNKTYPPIKTMAGSFLTSLTKELGAIVFGEKSVTSKEFYRRFAVCQSCEFFISKRKRCQKCGCFIKIKARMRSQKCPIGKW